MARDGGVGGIVGAAVYGAAISAGPWLITAAAVAALGRWSMGHPGNGVVVQTVLVYAFSLSAVIAAPIGLVVTRLAADRLFHRDPAGVPGILLRGIAIGGIVALLVGGVVFGWAGGLPLVQALLATLVLAWLAQVWIASPLLTAIRRYAAVPFAYGGGIAVAAAALALMPAPGTTAVLAAVAAGIAVTLAGLMLMIRRHFPGEAIPPPPNAIAPALALRIAAAGIAGTLAIWIDKWTLWRGPDSVPMLGLLRLNPVNDVGSFLGLLTMVPGLTMLLVAAETRFDRAFGDVIARCTGTSTLARIEDARGELGEVTLDLLRQLLLVQTLVAAVAWVFAAPIVDALGLDPRAVFAFRNTALGVVFHLVAIAATVVLAYYDLFGRVLLIWLAFVVASAAATAAQWSAGYAAFGWGYMAGAVVACAVGVAMVAEATVNLTFLLFVGNNPAVIGRGGRWL
jgi:uncharacterized membrane protein